MAQPGPWSVKRLDEMQRAFGGALVRVRAELGVSAFGLQVAELPPDSKDLAPEHDHEHDGQEEVYLLLAGSGEVVLDGTPVPWTLRRSCGSGRGSDGACALDLTARGC